MTTAQQVINIARKQIGVMEGRNKNGTWNNRVKYNTWYAQHPSIKNNVFLTTAWCATFVSWVANQAGGLNKVIPMHAWTPSGLNWFKKHASVTVGRGAKAGDIFYVYYPSKKRVAHVGIVESVSGNFITTIEGNTNTTGSRVGIGVYRLRRRITNSLHFAHPRYGATASAAPGSSKPAGTKVDLSKVSLHGLINAALTDPPKKGTATTNWAAVMPVEKALIAEGLLHPDRLDGHYGTDTVTAYSSWQWRCGYRGKDADGIPGKSSLVALGNKHGFTVVK